MVYVDNEYDFSPKEFLAELIAKKITPNRYAVCVNAVN